MINKWIVTNILDNAVHKYILLRKMKSVDKSKNHDMYPKSIYTWSILKGFISFPYVMGGEMSKGCILLIGKLWKACIRFVNLISRNDLLILEWYCEHWQIKCSPSSTAFSVHYLRVFSSTGSFWYLPFSI